MEHKIVKYLYSRQKNYETQGRNPKQCYTIYYKNEDDLKDKLDEIKTKQKKLNDEWEPIPLKLELPTIPFYEGLPPMSLEKDKPGSADSFCVLGSSKSGKTYIMKEINKQFFNDKSINCIFSPNIHADVYRDFKGIKFNKFDKECEKMIRQMRKVNALTNNKFRFIFNIDDIIDSKYSKILNELFLILRNSQMSSCILLQYPMLMSKAARSNVSHLLFGRFNNYESIEQICKIFLRGHFKKLYGKKTIDDYMDIYQELTDDYHFLYLDVKKNKLSRFKLNL